MTTNKVLGAVAAIIILSFSSAYGQTTQQDWGDFLHYAAIGRLDLAIAHGQRLVSSEPDPLEVLKLADDNPRSYAMLLDIRSRSRNAELAEVAGAILDIIDHGRYIKRTDSEIIRQEIDRLSSTATGRVKAIERIKDAGEFAVPHLLEALADPARGNELANITTAMGQLDKEAIRPLVAALQTRNSAVKAEIVRALGSIKYPEALPYLKYLIEQDESPLLTTLARNSINEIDPAALNVSAAELFVELAEGYFSHKPVLAPSPEGIYARIWFWDGELEQLVPVEVERAYFHDLMTMRCCEWALKADMEMGEAIGIWLAAFLRAESTGLTMPEYFDEGHADAQTYATVVGPEYVHQALAIALREDNAYMALALVDALALTAGEASLLLAVGDQQPLIQALYFDDLAVRYSAAMAIAASNPRTRFADSELVVELLAEALAAGPSEEWPVERADDYNRRALEVLHYLAVKRNAVLDLAGARAALIAATEDSRLDILLGAVRTLSLMDDPAAQRAVVAVALDEGNDSMTRIAAYGFLADSAKTHGNLLTDETVDILYDLVQSDQTDPQIRSAAASAYGSLNLPSAKAKKLILDQSKS